MTSRLKQAVPVLLLSALWLGCSAAYGGQDDFFRDINGKAQHPLEPNSVLIFYWHDCPICNSYAQEIDRLCRAHTNFSFYLVEVDPDVTPAAERQHAKEYALRPPMLLDGGRRLIHLARATVTPEAVVMGPNKSVLYRGRIDNLYPNLSQRRATATKHDLADALEAIASGKTIKTQAPAMGCLIQ